MQTTLTRILIVLESVSHGSSENSDEISRKFEGFFRPKSGGLQKKKKKRSSPKLILIFRPKFKGFFRPKSGGLQKKKKKKRSSPKLGLIFRPNSEIQTFQGGLFSIFHKKSASKALKTCDFAYFTSQWGGSSPPPWLRYWIGYKLNVQPSVQTMATRAFTDQKINFKAKGMQQIVGKKSTNIYLEAQKTRKFCLAYNK